MYNLYCVSNQSCLDRYHTFPEVNIHRAILAVSIPNAQLAVAVVAPAFNSASSQEHARVSAAQRNVRDDDAWQVRNTNVDVRV